MFQILRMGQLKNSILQVELVAFGDAAQVISPVKLGKHPVHFHVLKHAC